AGLRARIERLLGLDAASTLRFDDPAAGQHRAVRLDRSGQAGERATVQALMLAGDTASEAWLRTLIVEELPAQSYGRLLLAPGSEAPVALAPRGPQVCTCFNVSQPEIEAVLVRCSGSADQRLAQLQGELKCGTNCGSCIPTLKKLVRAGLQAA
ncbi:MAG: (2Fe-2S)-binding protein, partial [Aquabacterium sp.]|nr:(2Fe-2S)-binding protein [Aquabacterium sp.]